MKALYLSALVSCSLLAGVMVNGQGLPASFTAYRNNNLVIIRWSMVNETSTDHYTVERSTDNINFTPLHDVPAQDGGDGDYSYQDGDSYPSSGVNLYRLKIVDEDGNAVYSPVVRTDILGKKPPSLSPTVLHMGGTLHVTDTWYSQPLIINFFNQGGTRVGSCIPR